MQNELEKIDFYFMQLYSGKENFNYAKGRTLNFQKLNVNAKIIFQNAWKCIIIYKQLENAQLIIESSVFQF